MSRKNRMVTRIVTIVLALLMVIGLTIPAFAASEGEVVAAYNALSEEDKKKVEYSNGELKIGDDSVAVYANKSDAEADGATTVPVTLGNSTYYFTEEALNECKTSLENLKSTTDTKDKDQSVEKAAGDVKKISEAGIRANLDAAQDTLSGFSEILGVLLGILAYLIMMMLTVFTTIDIAYITIPPFRSLCDDTGAKSGGSGAMGSTNKSTGEAKFRWVTDEAMYSVQTATVESGKSAVVTYLGKRIFAIILVGIAIYLLLTGNIGLIMNLSLKMVSGIINQLANLGMK